ncbi:MAG: hypothetical protein ABIG44_09425 [Planctomycetota bacterium]
MADIDDKPVVLGLYRHDVPEEKTLRALLEWLSTNSRIMGAMNMQSSIEEAKERLRQAGLGFESADKNDLGLFIKFMLADFESSTGALDQRAIDRVVSSNDSFPQRLKIWCSSFNTYCPIEVGYADTVPDDPRYCGRRLIQISTIRTASQFLDDLAKVVKVPVPEKRPEYLRARMEELFQQCLQNIHVDYASIRCDRKLSSPLTLAESADPSDFHRVYVCLPAEEISAILLEYAEVSEWTLHPLPFGIYFRLRDEDSEPSYDGRRLIERLCAIFAERFGKA